MKNKQVDNYLNKAIDIIAKELEKNGTVPKEFESSLSSFGAAVIQSGVKPAVALFSDIRSKSIADKPKLMYCIYHLVTGEVKEKDKDKKLALLQSVVKLKDNSQELRKRKQDILNAAIALKLAIRAFLLEKTEKE